MGGYGGKRIILSEADALQAAWIQLCVDGNPTISNLLSVGGSDLAEAAMWEIFSNSKPGYIDGTNAGTYVADKNLTNDFVSEATVAISVAGKSDVNLVDTTSGSAEQKFIYESDKCENIYGPFIIEYPYFYSTYFDKEFPVGEAFKLLLNGTDTIDFYYDEDGSIFSIEKDGLPKSGSEFYLHEDSGIILGEENVFTFYFKGYYNFSGWIDIYYPITNLYTSWTCPVEGCGVTLWASSTGIAVNSYAGASSSTSLAFVRYADFWNLNSTLGHNNIKCSGEDCCDGLDWVVCNDSTCPVCPTGYGVDLHESKKGCYYTYNGLPHCHNCTPCKYDGINVFDGSVLYSKANDLWTTRLTDHVERYDEIFDHQRTGLISYSFDRFEVSLNLTFWPGRKIEIDLTKYDNGDNLLEGINFNVTLSGMTYAFVHDGNDTYILVGDERLGTSATLTTTSGGKLSFVIITYADSLTVTLEEPGNSLYFTNKPIVINFEWDGDLMEWKTPTYNNNISEYIDNALTVSADKNDIDGSGLWYKYNLKVINVAKIEEVRLIKVNSSVTGQPIAGVEFYISLKNAVFVSGDGWFETDENGEINLGTLKVNDPDQDIIITITETDVPTNEVEFHGLYGGGEAIITIKHRSNGAIVDVMYAQDDVISSSMEDEIVTAQYSTVKLTDYQYVYTYNDYSFKINNLLYAFNKTVNSSTKSAEYNSVLSTTTSSDCTYGYESTNNILIISIENIVTLDISGQVWLDGQTGLKEVVGANGQYDEGENEGENVFANIKVVARRVSDGKVVQTVRTDENGEYIFEDLPASVYTYDEAKNNGHSYYTEGDTNKNGVYDEFQYYVEFTYDGINYIATDQNVGSNDSIDSDVAEIDREEFNDKFRTIEQDMAIASSTDDSTLTLKYDITTDSEEAILITKYNGSDISEDNIYAIDGDSGFDLYEQVYSRGLLDDVDVKYVEDTDSWYLVFDTGKTTSYQDENGEWITVPITRDILVTCVMGDFYTEDGIIYTGGDIYDRFAMRATTDPTVADENTTDVSGYSKITKNVDLGLVRRGVDLAAVTDLHEAVVSINGTTRTYNYSDISLNDNIVIQPDVSPVYNLYLYSSDYTYRINDYGLDEVTYLDATQEDYLNVYDFADDEAIDDNVYTGESYATLLAKRQDYDEDGVLDGDLEILLTYEYQLDNQSATEATVNDVAFYYDTNLTLIAWEDPENKTSDDHINFTYLEEPDDVETVYVEDGDGNGGKVYKKVVLPIGQTFDDTDNQETYKLVFAVNKDDEGYIEGVNPLQDETYIYKTWVEIISYSTNSSDLSQGGCIDTDSAPDNITTHNTEDDTDDARGLNIELNDFDRTISGYVFEDMYTGNSSSTEYKIGDGYYNTDDGDSLVDDIIVQLIEIKYVDIGDSTYKLEYIWQETVSGSSTVKYVTSDGTQINSYDNGLDDDASGQYLFENFIAGDYIIRFIYGDGSYYDTSISGDSASEESKANILKYNGQDYKSTTDLQYTVSFYDNAVYATSSSMARDNEARRLEEMTYVTSLSTASKLDILNNTALLVIDDSSELVDTWMCADTSVVSIPVSEPDDSTGGTQITRGINFGLTERPQAELILEKHVIGVEIDGIGKLTTDIMEYYLDDDGVIDLTHEEGTALIYNTMTNIDRADGSGSIGIWHLETELDELSGNSLTITYGYVLENIGDVDFIGESLYEEVSNKGENSTGVTYKAMASSVKASLAKVTNYAIGTYLGKAYYTGNSSDDREVGMTVRVEDYLSLTNDLDMDDSDSSRKSNFTKLVDNSDEWVFSSWVYTDSYNALTVDEFNNYLQSEIEDSGAIELETVEVINTDVAYTVFTSKGIDDNGDGVDDNIISSIQLTLNEAYEDTTTGSKEFTYRSYAAQLIPDEILTSLSGTLIKSSTLDNLTYIQAYTDDVPVLAIVPEDDEYIAETVKITLPTGEDKETPVVLIASITGGLAVMALGIVLVKKFAIK